MGPGVQRRPSGAAVGFAAAFTAFALWTFVTGVRHPLGPGQDQHYHLMNASLTARYWLGDPVVRSLYRPINPLDANTLLYTLLFPLEPLLGPVGAWKVGFTLLYFVGYPVACVVALRLLHRPLWGALLAFPLAYVKTWSQGGYMPFVSAAPLFVIAIAAMCRLLEERPPTFSPLKPRLVLAAVSVLTLLAHAHVYAWLMFVLGVITLVALGRDLVPDLVRMPGNAVRAAAVRGLGALAIVAPSLLLFAVWHLRTHAGDNAASSSTWAPSSETWMMKVTTVPGLLVHTTADEEWKYVALLGVLVTFAVLLSRRPRRTLLGPELALVLSLASYFILPFRVSQQAIGLRHLDFVVWLIPLVVYPRPLPGAPFRAAVVIGAIASFTTVRLRYLHEQLAGLQAEFRGLFDVARPCPTGPAEVAYVTFGTYSTTWTSESLHQAHETFAAICRLDAPVYDPRIYPYNLTPIRYRVKPPAPPMILVSPAQWYRTPGLWEGYDFVLVRAWRPTADELAAASAVATRVRSSGVWELWARKPALAGRSPGEALP